MPKLIVMAAVAAMGLVVTLATLKPSPVSADVLANDETAEQAKKKKKNPPRGSSHGSYSGE